MTNKQKICLWLYKHHLFFLSELAYPEFYKHLVSTAIRQYLAV